MLLGTSSLIKVVPGLMIWTLVCFAITFYVLKRFAFGRIQSAIDERREKIRQSIEEADRATLREWINEMRTPGTGVFLGQ